MRTHTHTHTHTETVGQTASSSARRCHDAVLRADGSRLDTQYIHVLTLIYKGEHVHRLARMYTDVSLNVITTVRAIEAENIYIAFI